MTTEQLVEDIGSKFGFMVKDERFWWVLVSYLEKDRKDMVMGYIDYLPKKINAPRGIEHLKKLAENFLSQTKGGQE